MTDMMDIDGGNLSAFLLNDSDDRPLFLIIPLQFEPENPPIAFKKPTTSHGPQRVVFFGFRTILAVFHGEKEIAL